ncbi:unnamed protein product [Caenorhabditis auriculariae]|uniref:Serpentine receptor class r-10 n=1 Tax=Caenorhabditis auriculariae TaxID=2777116 RepID=A0A8S1H1V3_9PELO|nr:unnamed protein product [Caenorhabditis auriculariae]
MPTNVGVVHSIMLVAHVAEYLSFALSVVINGLLIYLIKTKSRKEMGSYKYLMMSFALFGIFYSTIDVLVQPLIHVYASTFSAIMILSTFGFNKNSAAVIISCFNMALTLLAVHFVYRYFAVCWPLRLRYFKGFRTFPCWAFVVMVLGLAWGLTTYFVANESPDKDEFLAEEFLKNYDLRIEEIYYVGSFYFTYDEDGYRRYKLSACLGMLNYTFLMSVSSSIVFYCGVKTYLNMRKEQDNKTKKMRNLQAQLFKVLVLQTVTPVVLMYIPCGFVFAAPLFEMEVGAYANFVPIFLALYPVIDPLYVIYFIRDHRESVKKWFNFFSKIPTSRPTYESRMTLIEKFSLQEASQGAHFSSIKNFIHCEKTLEGNLGESKMRRLPRSAEMAHGAEYVGFCLGVVINSTLIFLIKTKSRKELGVYRYLMMSFAFCGIGYSTVDLITQPLIQTHGTTFTVLTVLSTFDISKRVGALVVALYCAFFEVTLALLGVHFVYRYFAICRPNLLRLFEGFNKAIWVAVVLGFGLDWFLTTYFLVPETEMANRYLANAIMENYGLRMDEIAYIGPLYFITDSSGEKHFNLISCLGMANFLFMVFFSFGTVFFCGISTYRKMQQQLSIVTQRTRILQKQLFLTLIVQTIVPIFFMYIPIFFLFLSPLFELEIGANANFVSISLALYPVLDPLVAIYFISDYREAVKNFFKKCLPKKHSSGLVSTGLVLNAISSTS